MANPKHLKILRQGVTAWNKWRAEHQRAVPDLCRAGLNGADFRGMNLSGANLGAADLRSANLCQVDISGADLAGANLSGANLAWADLNHADLAGANLRAADLVGARLRLANLSVTNLTGADLGFSDFATTRVYGTVFGDNDLSGVKGLDMLQHFGPSTIGIDTIYKSKGKIPEVFLRGCGVPEEFITYMRSLVGKAIDFYSCFISYSSKDDDFAQRLYADLQAKNVRCWKFDENAKWGEPVWGEIDTAIRHYDKLVVICSEHPLQSPPVIREIERALQKEDREHRNVLSPIRIDDYLFDEWDHPRKADVVSKVAADFRGWENLAAYSKAFPRFLGALNHPN